MSDVVIRLPHATLRALTPADAPSLARNANDRRVWLNLRDAFPHPYTLEKAEEYIATFANQSPRLRFGIEVDGEICGGVGMHPGTDIERISAEVGYWIAAPHWGKGITTEALKAITVYGHEMLGLRRLFATPFASNAASARVLEKAGYVYEGRMRSAAIKDGVVVDMLLYAHVAEGAAV
ncbi:MAG: GNAT family protein [Phycisphaerales bacterium]